VKGRDDLRQDAVMQQVFVLVDTLLRRNPSTRTRMLSIRTYKAIPLTPRSGLLEWVDNTKVKKFIYFYSSIFNPNIVINY